MQASDPLTTEPPQDPRLRELERQNAELQRFASHAAHDLQEPLRLVSGYLDVLLAEHEAALPADARMLAREARDAALRMQGLVQGLLEQARATDAALHLETYPLSESYEEAMTNLAGAAGVACGPLPIVRADRRQITRVLQNLLSNALKFHAPDDPARVEVSARRAGREWEILVADHGLGLPEKAPLFEPFRRHHPQIPGTGLGLAACKAIVERHGGRIWATPTEGGGATFHFTLEPPP